MHEQAPAAVSSAMSQVLGAAAENPTDIIILALYLVASFVIGLMATKWIKADNSKESGYFLGGRNIAGWLAGTSIAVTAMNADVAPAYGGWMANTGLPMVWFYVVRFGVAQMVIAMLFCYMWRHMTISTGPEFFSLRYGGKGGLFTRVYSSLWGVCVGIVPWVGVGLLGVHKIFAPVFFPGNEEIAKDPTITLMVIMPVLTIYVWKAGYSGVLATDFMQSVVIILANVLACVLVLFKFGGPTGLQQAISSALPPADLAQAMSSVPVHGNDAISPWMCLPLFFLCTMGVGGGMSTDGQRIMSCKNTKEAMKSFIWAQLILFLMLLSLTLPIMGLFPTHPELFHADPILRENAYGMLLKEFMPKGVLGIALAAIAAAVMSTVASHMNYCSQTLVNDATRPFIPHMTDKQAIWLGKLYMLLVMILAIVVTYKAGSMSSVAMYLAGLFGGGALLGWAQWWWWRTNFYTWLAAMVVGPCMFFFLDPLLALWPWWADALNNETYKQTLNLWKGLMSMGLCTTLWIAITLATPPESARNLKEFYLRAKPMGAWGPVRRAINADGIGLPTQKSMILYGIGVAVIGAAWIALLMLTLSHLYVGLYLKAVVSGVACVGLAYLFKLLFNWYYERLGGDDDKPFDPEAEKEQTARLSDGVLPRPAAAVVGVAYAVIGLYACGFVVASAMILKSWLTAAPQ